MDKDERNVSFTFKRFAIADSHCGMKVGTDAVALGAWATCNGAEYAIDIGCGSGVIALMIAQRCDSYISAIEVDENAVTDAIENAKASPWSSRVNVVCCDFCDFIPACKADLIISNPPYFENGEPSPSATRASARHEGTLNYSSLINYAVSHLKADGRLAFIYPYGHEDEVIYKAEMSRMKLRRICHLRQRTGLPIIRTMYEFSPTDGHIEKDELTIRDGHGYSNSFANLTKDFYLNI